MAAAEEASDSAASEGTQTASDGVAKATPVELKGLGNDAWKQQDVAGAVDLWNQALRLHVESMHDGSGASAALSDESRNLERSLYLNLAQGLLRLAEPARALRACKVVLQENAKDVKARYRAAEAHICMKEFAEASRYIAGLMAEGDEEVQADAARLQQRVRIGQQAEAKRQKEVAKRMWGATEGFSEGRQEAAGPSRDGSSRARAALTHMDPVSLAAGVDIAEAAAKAGRVRESRLAEEAQALPEPTVPPDLEAFRARIMAKTSKYSASTARSRQQRQNAERSVKLQWLRGGQSGAGLDAFKQPLQEELEAIKAQGVEEAAKVATVEEEAIDHLATGSLGDAIAESLLVATAEEGIDTMD